MATSQILRDNAPYHSKLIADISELDYVPSALKHQTSYVEELQTRLKQSESKLKRLSETTMKERKDYESLRDSTARRLAHKLSGRKEQFHSMATKEEREYVDALEKEFAEKDIHDTLLTMTEEAQREKATLAEKAIRYDALKKELCDLYKRVFDGPTEEYPEDDRLEQQVRSTQVLHDRIQNTVNAECRACEILAQADRAMNACEARVKEALAHSQRDMWGGRYHDVWERNSLSSAQAAARHTEDLCQQARNVSPAVKPIGPLTISRGSLLADIFFSDIFSDTAYHRKIAASAADLQRAHNRLRMEYTAAQSRANNAGGQLIEIAQTLEVTRIALASYRCEVFLGISQQGEASQLASDQPPSYYAASTVPPAASATTPPAGRAPSSSAQVEEQSRSVVPPGPVSSPGDPVWGSRNPYAATLAIRSRPPSYDER